MSKTPRRDRKPPSAPGKAHPRPAMEKRRLWLMYPPRLIGRPVIWELGKRFDLVTNLRQASVTHDIGIVCLELEGSPGLIAKAITWLERLGIKVEPVEITVLES